jgi:hypothetical protein
MPALEHNEIPHNRLGRAGTGGFAVARRGLGDARQTERKIMKITVNDGAHTERATLAHKPEDPPRREVLKQLRIELAQHIRSFKERDGVIRDESEIYEIGCLLKAYKLLGGKKGRHVATN